ncbi:Spo0E like sporulation regulatory protein [Anaerobacterium chartisolvens]|uniref:Spo0E like sporulation regulatory protein n=1 Tax=Anaerobacterium chartisolvens TaxID=1297424 RepID=A0A369ASL9_9FIRM|nr:Spo0E family sporulation regulatory protein-aspartic acid phosphatase [Anaerobacterium chartisolvens]RCX12360.1 Spo0E like sporulation regulatory protein [Anaerobacterium chartisolvens]
MNTKDMDKLKEILNEEVSCDNLTHGFILLMSMEIDIMIVDYYQKQLKKNDMPDEGCQEKAL